MDGKGKNNNLQAKEFIEELVPIMRDFFAGKFTCEDNVLHCELYGGRHFTITVDEVNGD